jgi:homoserine kinase type II
MKTSLSLEELQAALRPFALRPRRVRPFEKGTINSNFRADTDGGTVFVRVNEGKREADVRYEGELLWHLGARRFPTPQPLRTERGEPFVVADVAGRPRFLTVFPWTPGAELDEAQLTPERAGHLGATLAALHLAARDFPLRRDGIYTFERIAERVEAIRSRAHEVAPLAEVLAVLDDEIAFLRRERAGMHASYAALPAGTIHGDLFPDNVLWEGDRIAAVLDFEQASVGPLAYDLAVTLLAWCWGGSGFVEPRAWSLVAGYQRARPLDEEERERFFIEARFAALRFTVTRITDVFLPSLPPLSVPPRPGKDFRDWLARLLALRAGGPEVVEPLVDERPPLRAV